MPVGSGAYATVSVQLWEQTFAGLGILHKNRADGTVLRCLQDLLDTVALGVDGLRLTVVIQSERVRGDRLAHRVPDTGLGINPDSQLSGHWLSPSAR